MAYAIWGLIPVYWKELTSITAPELLYSRLILTAVSIMILLPMRGSWRHFMKAWQDGPILRQRLLAAVLLSINWFSFMWAVNHDRVLESSLGYFLCPIVSVLLGRFVEREHLGRTRWIAVGLASAGVAIIIAKASVVPVAGIAIAISWSAYGLIKKRSSQGPLVALGLETSLLTPLAMGMLLWTAWSGPLTITQADPKSLGFLLSVGFVTVGPLVLFAFGAQRIRLTTMGMGQYIVPSTHFGLALVYGEPVTGGVVAGFAFIWLGLLIYSLSGRQRKAVDGTDAE
jgi:chloramphenicol-sensitive protein RarD